MYANRRGQSAYTLVEVVLVVALLVAISALAIPNFIRELEREELPGSARQLRSLITLTRANAAFDGLRYRIRFPADDEEDLLLDRRQPMIEREDDPIHEPDVFNQVTAPWAIGTTLLRDVRCAEVRPGRPTIAKLKELRKTRDEIEESLREAEAKEEHFDPERPPLYIEPDGSSEWATFVLTDAPPEIDLEALDEDAALEEWGRIDVIAEGLTGLTWMQRPFYDEELDLFEEKGWPAVLRQDFLDPRLLTEDDVLELHEVQGRRRIANVDNQGKDTGAVEEPALDEEAADVPVMGEGGQ